MSWLSSQILVAVGKRVKGTVQWFSLLTDTGLGIIKMPQLSEFFDFMVNLN